MKDTTRSPKGSAPAPCSAPIGWHVMRIETDGPTLNAAAIKAVAAIREEVGELKLPKLHKTVIDIARNKQGISYEREKSALRALKTHCGHEVYEIILVGLLLDIIADLAPQWRQVTLAEA